MKRKTMVGLLGALAFTMIGGGALLAQRVGGPTAHRAKTITMWNDEGRVRLGVRLSDVDSENARNMKLASAYGAVVTEVEPDSAAAKAGLAANDVILEFDGERVRSVAQLRRLVQDTPSGRTVAVKVSRSGQTHTLNVKLEAASHDLVVPEIEMPDFEVPEIHGPEFNFEFFNGGPRLGISADELTPQLAEYFGVTEGKGVLVREVSPGSSAEKAGLKAGDCIVRVGTEKVESVSDLHRALGRSTDAKRQVSLTIVRNRQEQTLTAELEPARKVMSMPRSVTENDFVLIDPIELSHLPSQIKAIENQRLTVNEGVEAGVE